MSDKGDIQDRISRRAHEIWEREGHPHGRHGEHWAQAEAEIRAEDGAKPAVAPDGPATTRTAAESLSAIESAPAPALKAASKPGKAGGGAKPADAKPARAPRKGNGKSAAPR